MWKERWILQSEIQITAEGIKNGSKTTKVEPKYIYENGRKTRERYDAYTMTFSCEGEDLLKVHISKDNAEDY